MSPTGPRQEAKREQTRDNPKTKLLGRDLEHRLHIAQRRWPAGTYAVNKWRPTRQLPWPRQDHAGSRTASNSEPIALGHDAASAIANLQVTSPDFDANEAIPERRDDYGEGRSPGPRWNGISAAGFYAVLVDPDAPTAQPFVH